MDETQRHGKKIKSAFTFLIQNKTPQIFRLIVHIKICVHENFTSLIHSYIRLIRINNNSYSMKNNERSLRLAFDQRKNLIYW